MHNLYKYLKELKLIAGGMGFWFAVRYLWNSIMCVSQVLRERSLGSVDARVGNVFSVKSHGHNFRFPPESISVVREIHLHDCYGFDVSHKYETILDFGANTGVFSVLAAKFAKRVISVECNTTHMPAGFSATMRLNGVDNTVFVNKAISTAETESETSVMKIIKEFGIDAIDFLKIDIEGAEQALFRTDINWLRITRRISMEVHPCFGVDVGDLLKKLHAFGFSTKVLDKELNVVETIPADSMGYIRAIKI